MMMSAMKLIRLVGWYFLLLGVCQVMARLFGIGPESNLRFLRVIRAESFY